MTAEVAVMNAQAVALAADSAVSIDGSPKAFTSADKIFGISAWEPIAAMIHGNASFMGIPWETIIKSYRRQLNRKCFASVAEYAEHFVRYLELDSAHFFPEDVRDKQARNEIRLRLEPSIRVLKEAIRHCIEKKGRVTEGEIALFLEGDIAAIHIRWSEAKMVPGLTEERATALVARYASDARQVQDEVFRDLPITSEAAAHLADLRGWFLTRVLSDDESSHTSGVVFAGFGVAEHFPHVVEYRFEAIVGETLRYCRRNSFEVSRSEQAAVFAFGQEDMVLTFMHGIDPGFKDLISKSLRQFLVGYSDVILDAVPNLSGDERDELKARFRKFGQEAFLKYRQSLKDWRRREYAERTLEVIGTLPKEELATVAESLVSLTSLKRRVSRDASVSPPVDVCVISKHDGCVWVKKKHYFPMELNPSFYIRHGHVSRLDGESEEDEQPRRGLPDAAGSHEAVLSHPDRRAPD